MKVKNVFTYFTDTILRRNEDSYRNPRVRWAVRQYKLLFYTARGLIAHDTIVRSAALTFYTLISIVPILALVFAVVKGFGLLDGLIDDLYALFPQNVEVLDYMVEFARKALANTQGGLIALVSVVTLFWAVIRVFGSVESAFNNIWEVQSSRNIARQYLNYIGHRDGRPDPLARGQHDGRLSAPVLRRGEYVPRHPSFETLGPGHHLGQLHPDLCRRTQYESLVAQRFHGGYRRRNGLHALSVGLPLSARVDDLLQRDLRQFRSPAALSVMAANLVGNPALRRRTLVRLPEYRPFRRRARIARHQLRPTPPDHPGRHAPGRTPLSEKRRGAPHRRTPPPTFAAHPAS